MEFTNKTQLQMEPGASEAIDLGTAAEAYTTPEHLRTQLGDLARLSYLRATWSVDLAADAASTAIATVELLAGATVVASTEIDLAGGTRAGAQQAVDVSGVAGSAPLSIRVTVTTAEAGRTAVLRSWVELEHPLMISNC